MVVWSLFDGSGIMGLSWAEAGHDVYCFNADSGNHGEYVVKMKHENIHYINIWIDDNFDDNRKVMGIPDSDIIFGFPDCTMFAQSGSQHERSERDIDVALSNARMIEGLGNKYDLPWMVENPVGKLSTLWRKPDHYFHPWQYGGWLREDEGSFDPKMPACDGYTKRTAIWCGNGFVIPEFRPGPINIGYFWAWRWKGGKSAKTKQFRSLTPRGFARAVYAANGEYLCGCGVNESCDDCTPF